MVEAKLGTLGLRFRIRKRTAGRRVPSHTLVQGHDAGLGFECTPGAGHDG